MYFDSLPCLNYYVDSANPDFMCECESMRVCVSVCVYVCTSSAKTSEVIIYVSPPPPSVACTPGCCVVLYRKNCLQKVSMHTFMLMTAIYNWTVFISFIYWVIY